MAPVPSSPGSSFTMHTIGMAIEVQKERQPLKTKAKACAVPVPAAHEDDPVVTQLADAQRVIASKNDDVLKVKGEFKTHRVQKEKAQGAQASQAVEQKPLSAILDEVAELGKHQGMFLVEGPKMPPNYKALEAKISMLQKEIAESTTKPKTDEADLIQLLQKLGSAWAKFIASKRRVDRRSEQHARFAILHQKMTERFEKMKAVLAEVHALSESMRGNTNTYKGAVGETNGPAKSLETPPRPRVRLYKQALLDADEGLMSRRGAEAAVGSPLLIRLRAAALSRAP